MVQIKKERVRTRVLESAKYLFSRHSYHQIQMAKIAERTGIATANIYTYFDSKFDLIYNVYGQILLDQLDDIALKATALKNPRKRAAFVLKSFWIDCTRSHGLLAHNFMQALTLLDDGSGYSDELLNTVSQKIFEAMALTDNDSRLSTSQLEALNYLIIMAFDGFAINSNLDRPSKMTESAINAFVQAITN